MEWKAKLEHWSVDHFSWICPWFQSDDIIVRCRDYPSVPLMDLRGCIAYSPRLAMRQLMRTQTIPLKEELGGLCFFYDPSHREAMLSVSRAWEKPVYIGDRELRKPRGVPHPSTQDVPTSANKELQEKVKALTKKLEIMGAQLRALEEKEEESILIIDGLQWQYKKKDQDIEQIKEECTATHEEVTHATKIQKVDSGSQLHEALKKIVQLESECAQQAQLIRMMQDDLTLTRSNVQKWWEVAQQRTTSLSEFKEKEKKGLAQMRHICEEKN
ncbi:hypothetical protein Fmac_025033 [Flemingia macrophylla]|uniref:DUF7745 domain-containing protein n=1 Tax=Flemingia macrophylla TaxID=520843 RepID=A0ABD1LR36_9FABA